MDADPFIHLRRTLHAHPELSGREAETARRIAEFLAPYGADAFVKGLGGHGLAVVFNGRRPGKTVLFRGDIDALPIQEPEGLPYRSACEGVAHKCGHDGHAAMLAGVASLFARERPEQGRVVVLFQPGEETGEGAPAVLADPQFAGLRPDYVFGVHNLPGFPLHSVILRPGPFAAASKGMIITLEGKTSHAAEPEKGISPAMAVAQLLPGLTALPGRPGLLRDGGMATVISVRLGEHALGTSPGHAEVIVTMRAYRDEDMALFTREAEHLVGDIARQERLAYRITYEEEFPATVNDAECVEAIRETAVAEGLAVQTPESPFRWSEDFGHFTGRFRGALFGIGSGEDHPSLHNQMYDFPDAIIATGMALMRGVYTNLVKRGMME